MQSLSFDGCSCKLYRRQTETTGTNNNTIACATKRLNVERRIGSPIIALEHVALVVTEFARHGALKFLTGR